MSKERAEYELPVRLAIRSEGTVVNAYVAASDTMDGAMFIGSISKAVSDARPELFEEWKALMTHFLSVVVEDILGRAPDGMIERVAPEHERTGHS